MVASILQTFLALRELAVPYDQKFSHWVKEYMSQLARVPRFDTVLLFMSKEERQVVKAVWDWLGVDDDGAREWGLG